VTGIEELATRLVQQAPDLDRGTLEQIGEELLAIARFGSAEPRSAAEGRRGEWIGSPLALSMRRIYELVEMDVVNPAIALPALAEACATLVAGIEGRVGTRELEAARYQIDTLQPVPDPPQLAAPPDVPITQLRKR
jgi:hypothetical protein